MFHDVLRKLLLLDLLFEDVEQMHRVGGDLRMIVIEDLRENLEREARRQPRHAFVGSCEIAVLLIRLRLGIDVLEIFAVIDAHLGIDAGILGLLEARQHRELTHHLQGAGCAGRVRQRGMDQQLLVDLHLLVHAQAIRHFHDVDAIEEGLVVLVVLEGLPFRFVGVREDNAVERNGGKALRALVIALLRGGQQGMQHLDRRLEHLDELEQALIGEAEAARIAVGIRIILGVLFELADVDLAAQARDVVIVFITRHGFGDGDLKQHRRKTFHHLELGDVAVELVQAFHSPRRHDPAEIACRYAVVLFEDGAVFLAREQAEWRLVHRRTLDRIERNLFHQRFQLLRQRGLAAARGAEQIEYLLFLFEALCGVAEEGHDLLDGVFHAVEVTKRGIDLEHLVGEDPREALLFAGVDQLWFVVCLLQSFGGRGEGGGVGLAYLEVFVYGELFCSSPLVPRLVIVKDVHNHLTPVLCGRAASALPMMPLCPTVRRLSARLQFCNYQARQVSSQIHCATGNSALRSAEFSACNHYKHKSLTLSSTRRTEGWRDYGATHYLYRREVCLSTPPRRRRFITPRVSARAACGRPSVLVLSMAAPPRARGAGV